MFGSEELYESAAPIWLAACVGWNPSQNLNSFLFWHGVRPRVQNTFNDNGQQASFKNLKPEIRGSLWQ